MTNNITTPAFGVRIEYEKIRKATENGDQVVSDLIEHLGKRTKLRKKLQRLERDYGVKVNIMPYTRRDKIEVRIKDKYRPKFAFELAHLPLSGKKIDNLVNKVCSRVNELLSWR